MYMNVTLNQVKHSAPLFLLCCVLGLFNVTSTRKEMFHFLVIWSMKGWKVWAA